MVLDLEEAGNADLGLALQGVWLRSSWMEQAVRRGRGKVSLGEAPAGVLGRKVLVLGTHFRVTAA